MGKRAWRLFHDGTYQVNGKPLPANPLQNMGRQLDRVNATGIN
jgi:hypothetical protein